MLTKEELAEIEARANAVLDFQNIGFIDIQEGYDQDEEAEYELYEHAKANILALLADIRAKDAVIAELRAAAKDYLYIETNPDKKFKPGTMLCPEINAKIDIDYMLWCLDVRIAHDRLESLVKENV